MPASQEPNVLSQSHKVQHGQFYVYNEQPSDGIANYQLFQSKFTHLLSIIPEWQSGKLAQGETRSKHIKKLPFRQIRINIIHCG